MLIPYCAPRDKISFKLPPSIKQQMLKAQQIKDAQQNENEYIDMHWDDDYDDYDEKNNENNEDELKNNDDDDDDRIDINASYAFGALPDQRLFADNKVVHMF